MLFIDGEGREVIKSFPVDKDDYEHALKVGNIPITYVANHPDYSIVGKYYNYNRAPLFVAIVFSIITLALIISSEFLYRNKDPKIGMNESIT